MTTQAPARRRPTNAASAAGRLRTMSPTGEPAPRPVARSAASTASAADASSPHVDHAPSNSTAGAAGSSASTAWRRSERVFTAPSALEFEGRRCARSRPAPIGLPRRVYIRPCSIAARYGLSRDSQIARTVPWVATAGYDAMSRARSCACGQSSSRPTTSVTRPSRSAVSADTRSALPVRAMRSVSPSPMRRINPIGSMADTKPYVTWESKNVASSEQITTSASLRK